MGRERACRAKFGRQAGEGRALLETDELVFRGEFRAKVPLREIESLATKAGVLTVRWPGGTLALSLGDAAEKWAEAIRNPKSVLAKLGVEPGLRVAVIGVKYVSFLADLARALGAAPARRAGKHMDLVFAGIHAPADHARLAALIEAIRPAGGIWAIYPRGRKDVSEDTLRAAARRAGLVDVKIVRFSESHGAVKLVIPKAAR